MLIQSVTPIKDNWYEISNNCLGFNYGMFNLMQKSAACDKIIGSFKEFVDSYYQIDSVFTNTLFNTQKLIHYLMHGQIKLEAQ